MHQANSSRSPLPAAIAVLLAAGASLAHAQVPPIPEKLTAASYDIIKARVSPAPQDLAWQQIHWRDGFFDGLVEAQARDMPIFYWSYFGDPRGRC